MNITKQLLKVFSPVSALAVAGIFLPGTSAHAAPTVWNVNIGTEITTSNNYIGAAPENTANSTWNSFVTADLPSPKSLADSTGIATAVTFRVTGSPSMPTIGATGITVGDKIFQTSLKGLSNTSDFTCTFANLTPGDTYDLVVYADWYWGGGAIAITQSSGTGLAAPFVLNFGSAATDDVGPLLEDTNPANVSSTTNKWNFTRLRTLTPDSSGNLAFLIDGGNWPICGFQLVKLDLADATPPTPNPMTFATPPAAAGETSITMTATTAIDPSGVEYYFTETTGNPGATDSGWQGSAVYTDTGLIPATTYTYTVMARDLSLAQNTTTASDPASATTATNIPTSPGTVFNVNIASTTAITTGDNFVGAAAENTANSTWNSVTSTPQTGMALADSTGVSSAGVTLDLTGAVYSQPISSGDKIFSGCLKGNSGVNTTLAIKNLNPAGTFDLIIYSDWYWRGSAAYPVTQTAGTGLTGTFWVNHITAGSDGNVPPLTEDTNPANNGTILGNWCRIKGLTPDASGRLGFQLADGTPAYNCAFNGFQLVDKTGGSTPDTTPPTPSPMTWSSAPAAASSSSITMTATTASDPSGVEYYFAETSGNPGGTSSGWQNSPTYTDTGLNPSTTYTYTVKARDKSPAQNETVVSSAASATTNPPPSGAVVWNVNIGNQITTPDNYAGAVPQSTPINWNSITSSSYTGLTLQDSTGSTTGGIALDLTSDRAAGGQALTSGDKIFIGYFGGAGAASTMTLRGLTVAKTYDILFFSDWYWKNGDSLPITQTAGTGLSGTFFLNRILSGSDGTVPVLTQDTNPANVTSGAGNIGNYCRIVGIVPDGSGKVSFRIGDGANTAFNGFQLVQTGDVAPRADMLTFGLPGNPAVISGNNVTLTLPYSSDVTNLAPTFTLWPGATCVPVSGTARNFTSSLTYTVTSSDSQVTKIYTPTASIAPPLPEFYLTAPTTWDGRQTITVQAIITNLALLQATGGTNFNYQWMVNGVAVTKQVGPGVLSLTRSQGSGPLVVTLTMDNGTTGVTNSTTINVQEPATDPWVERTPGATEKPVTGQFFARNPVTGLGTIFYNGTESGNPDTVYLKVYKTPSGGSETLETTHRQSLVSGTYAFSAPITAGLITYRVVYGTTTGGVDTDVEAVTDLLCGDAYIIEGQSNAVATDNSAPRDDTTSPWIRTYGRSGGAWGSARSKASDPLWEMNIGLWGMELAKSMVTDHQIPVCFINGAVGGTRIDEHQANPVDHTTAGSLYSIYANLLNRVIEAKLTHGIRGIFWHQGESDCSNFGPILDYDYTAYEQNFLNMSDAWKQDYPNLQRYFIYQVMPKPCGIGPKGDQLREVQRNLPRLYSKMSILNTLGIVGYEGCHFSAAGYANVANRMAPLVSRDFYGVVSGASVTAPNLKRAYFTSSARTAIALEFDQAMSWSSFSLPNYYLDKVGGKVTSGSASGNVVTLQLSSAAAATASLDYLEDNSWNPGESVSSLLYGANAIPALTFADVPIGALSPYDTWAGGTFANAFTAKLPTNDPDGDGQSNQDEFAFGLDPTSASSVHPIIQQLAGGVFKYTRTKDSGLTYKIYYSTTLSAWTLDAGATQSPAAAVAGVETVTVTLDSAAPSDGKLFVRVEASPTPAP